jgi:hypothetical protein
LQALAAPSAFISRCHYELTFSYPAGGRGDFYEVDWRITVTAEVLDRRGYSLVDPVFVVPRHDGQPTSYTQWRFQSEDGDLIAFDGRELEAMGATSCDASGRTVLDQSKIPGIERIPFGMKYRSERLLATSRWAADYLPLFQPRIVLQQVIVIRGAGVTDLEFTVAQLGGTQAAFTPHTRANGETELRCELTQVSFPGQASLLTWKPKEK